MKQLLILTFILTLISCSRTDEKLGDNQTVKSIFDNNEIQDLEKILTFFEHQICKTENIPSDNALICYESFFSRMDKAEESGDIDIQIPFENQIELYNQIDTSTFNQLWTFNWSWKFGAPDSLKSITFNYEGKYVRFLESFGKENKIIKDYYESFQAAGDISPNMVARLLKMYKEYDTKDIRIRLLVAMHYLTMNDQYKRKEKYQHTAGNTVFK
jgi:hypothetical protein